MPERQHRGLSGAEWKVMKIAWELEKAMAREIYTVAGKLVSVFLQDQVDPLPYVLCHRHLGALVQLLEPSVLLRSDIYGRGDLLPRHSGTIRGNTSQVNSRLGGVICSSCLGATRGLGSKPWGIVRIGLGGCSSG